MLSSLTHIVYRMLTKLDISSNDLVFQKATVDYDSDDNEIVENVFCCVSSLAKVLPQCTSLTSLDMSNNRLFSEGATAIADVLPDCR